MDRDASAVKKCHKLAIGARHDGRYISTERMSYGLAGRKIPEAGTVRARGVFLDRAQPMIANECQRLELVEPW